MPDNQYKTAYRVVQLSVWLSDPFERLLHIPSVLFKNYYTSVSTYSSHKVLSDL